MASLGSIFVSLILDDAQFVAGTKRATTEAKNLKKSIDETMEGIKIATGIAAAGFTALLANQINVMTQTGLMAKSLGVATTEFQALTLVAKEAGLQQDELAKLFGKSQEAIVKAAQGQGSKAFKDLGIDIKDIINLAPDKQFEAIALKLSAIQNPTIQVGLAMEIFGRNGRDVLNMLPGLSKNLDEARAFNEKFNISLSDIDTEKIKEAKDTFEKLQSTLGGFFNAVAVQFAPAIIGIGNAFFQSGVDANSFSNVAGKSLETVGVAVDGIRISLMGLRAAFDVLNISAGGLSILMETLTRAMQPFNQGIQDAMQKATDYAGQKIKDAAADLQNLNNDFSKFQTTAQLIAQATKEAQISAEAAVKAHANRGNNNPDLTDNTKAQEKLNSELQRSQQYLEGVDKATVEYQKHAADLQDLFAKGKITYEQYNNALGVLNMEFQDAANKGKGALGDLSEFGKEAAKNIQDAFANFLFDPFKGGLSGMVKGFADAMLKMMANAEAAQLSEAIFGKNGSAITGLLGNLFGGGGDGSALTAAGGASSSVNWNQPLPAFANGGYLQPGQWGIAGEKEAELIYGGRTGATVIPPSKMANANNPGNQYYIDATGADTAAIARLEKALFALAGPGVVEKRVTNAQQRGKV